VLEVFEQAEVRVPFATDSHWIAPRAAQSSPQIHGDSPEQVKPLGSFRRERLCLSGAGRRFQMIFQTLHIAESDGSRDSVGQMRQVGFRR
jgi:hypothetical protein